MKMFGLQPVIAMISYANYGSSKDPRASKVREAVEILHKTNPDMIVDGELQADGSVPMLDDGQPHRVEARLLGERRNA